MTPNEKRCSISLLQKIEQSFDVIWHVTQLRSLGERVSRYLSALLVGPILVFAALDITAIVLNSQVVQGLLSVEPFGRPELAGVERWDDSAVVLGCRFKVAPLEQWGVRREFLRRLKKAFGARGIEIRFPHITVYGAGKDGGSPPFRVLASQESTQA